MQSVSIGIDIGGTSIKYGIVDSRGNTLWESKRPTMAKTTKELVKKNVLDAAHETIAVAKQKGLLPVSIGIGTPGLVSNNVILGGADNIEGWVNVHLGAYIQEATNLQTWVTNDVDAMAFAEYKNSFENNESVVFITLGTGIGGAMIINGELFQGHYGCGGELGVFPMVIDGQVHYWEDLGSTSALIRLYEKKSGKNDQDINGKLLIDQFLNGDTIAKDTIVEWAKYVGLGIAGYINVFNPKSVVIGGGISEDIDLFLTEIISHANQYCLKECLDNVTIVPAQLGNKAGFTGAALYALSKIEKN